MFDKFILEKTKCMVSWPFIFLSFQKRRRRNQIETQKKKKVWQVWNFFELLFHQKLCKITYKPIGQKPYLCEDISDQFSLSESKDSSTIDTQVNDDAKETVNDDNTMMKTDFWDYSVEKPLDQSKSEKSISYLWWKLRDKGDGRWCESHTF